MRDLFAEFHERILILSANHLFGKGLESLILKHRSTTFPEIRRVWNLAEAVTILEEWKPDLVIVDYDDQTIDRAAFLQHFVASDYPMQVLLVSLQDSERVIIYDRRTITPAQAELYLNPSQGISLSSITEKKVERRNGSMRHFFIVVVLVIVSTVLVNTLLNSVGLLPVQASLQASTIDRLFDTHFFLISFLFSLIVVFLGYSIVVFRRKSEDDYGKYVTGSSRLEVIWTIIPLGIVVYLAYLGSQSLAEVRQVDPQAMVVNVTAGQWFWRYEYPDFGITSQSLNLPVNEQVLLRMTSLDVIHSFWVPEFRVKQDILPGENLVKELRVTPTQLGTYTVRCAELCGGSHAYMNSPVVVMTREEFDRWVSQELAAVSSDPVARGQRLVAQNGCIGCHSLDDKPSVGPTWQGLFGKEQELTDGSKVIVDEDYLKEAILFPNAKVPKGFAPGIMPEIYQTQLSEQQLTDIIAFIKSLQ